jgi:hypothetical protein
VNRGFTELRFPAVGRKRRQPPFLLGLSRLAGTSLARQQELLELPFDLVL